MKYELEEDELIHSNIWITLNVAKKYLLVV
jgi:hypothetical protein